MAGMRMENFGGMVPLLSRRLLPDSMAVNAANAYLRAGEVRGFREPKLIKQYASGGGDPVYKRAIRIPDPADPVVPVWVPFTSPFSRIFPNPLKNDAYNRFIWLDGNDVGSPQLPMQNSLQRIKDGDPAILLGVPSPAAAMGLSVAGGSTITITRAYVYTYVNLFGEESQPSPSVVVSGFIDGTWNLTGIVNPAFATDRGITKVRIYRSITGGGGTAFYRVVEQNVTTATYADTRLDSVVAQESLFLQSAMWEIPLEMEGIIAMPNGFFAGWNGKDIYFSEPYRPWAWPAEYTLTSAYKVIDAGAVDQTMVALTATSPVLVTGVSPAGMSIAATQYVEPCLGRGTVVQAPEGVYFASPNGLTLISPAGMTSITREVIGRDSWQRDYVPKINAAASFDSQYVAHGAEGTGFVFDPRGLQSGIIDIVNYPDVGNVWTDPYTAQAHLMIANGVYEWSNEQSPFLAATWLSKEFQFPRPLNLGAFMVTIDPRYGGITVPTLTVIDESALPVGGPWDDLTSIINYNQINGDTINDAPADGSLPPGEAAPVAVWPYWYGVVPTDAEYDLPPGAVCEFTVFADSAIVWRGLVESGVVYRLPSGFKSDTWQIQIKTRVPVLNVQIAETAKELARV